MKLRVEFESSERVALLIIFAVLVFAAGVQWGPGVWAKLSTLLG